MYARRVGLGVSLLSSTTLLSRRGGGGGGEFSPASLFTAGEQGAWYDPSDLTTMWQDNQGVTPVTAPSQSVGLILDKRIGTRTQVFDDANVTFTGTAGYAGRISPGVYEYARDAVGIGTVDFGGLVSGRSYIVSVQISAYAGAVPLITATRADFSDGATATRPFVSAAGTYTFYFVATVSGNFTIRSGALGAGGTISNVSILEVPGNHATQATAAQRPTYGIVPATGRRNRYTQTEAFDTAAWSKLDSSVTPNTGTAPNGTLTADTVTATAAGGRIIQFNTYAAETYTFSLWMRRVSGTGIVRISTNGFNTVDCALTGSWQRFSMTSALIADTNAAGVIITTSGDAVEVWGAQFEISATATDYQRVVTAFDVTEAGVASLPYLSFDGTDDNLATASVVWGTGNVTVTAGQQKLSDAAAGTVLAIASGSGTIGGFELTAPQTAAPAYRFGSRGDVANVNATSGNVFPAPDTGVITGLGSVPGAVCTLRRNAVEIATNTTAQGTINYTTNPLYIGRRGGTTQPYNGQIFNLVIRNALTSGADLTNLEAFVAGKTGLTI